MVYCECFGRHYNSQEHPVEHSVYLSGTFTSLNDGLVPFPELQWIFLCLLQVSVIFYAGK